MSKPFHPSTITTRVLMFLVHQKGKWATHGPSMYMPSVQAVFPIGTSEEAQFRFMRFMMRNGWIDGCDCGCRGDWVIADKGLTMLIEDSLIGEQMGERYND